MCGRQFREPIVQKMPDDEIIHLYKQLIQMMPRANQYLLLYLLDLFSVFARKAKINMTSASGKQKPI